MRIIFAAILAIWSINCCVEGLPNYDYSSDNYDNYDDDNLVNEEQETEINYDIKFKSMGTTHVVDKGTTIKLPCNVDKYPENFVIMWKKVEPSDKFLVIGSNVLDSSDSRISVEINRRGEPKGSTLLIALAKDEDAGHYVCQLGDGDNKEIKHTVQVRDPPSITKTPSNGLQKAHKGDDVTLSCVGSGNPQPVITWSRMNKKLPDGRQELRATELSFKNVNKHHAGTYVCTADNGFGQVVKEKITLDVEYSPEVEVEEYFIHATEQNQVELVCLVHAHPQATVQWFKDTVELTDDNVKLERLGHRHTLTIPSISHSDYGNYTCRAKNTHGEKSRILEVSGMAGFANFKSSARGQEANSFLLEWTSESQTPIEEFELMWREEESEWEGFTVPAYKQNDFNWSGKHGFTGLSPATRYEARVLAKNSEGWSRPSPSFHFATFGADNEDKKETSTKVQDGVQDDFPTVVSAEAKEPLTEAGSATISTSNRIVTAFFVILIAKLL